MGGSYYPIFLSLDLKDISFIKILKSTYVKNCNWCIIKVVLEIRDILFQKWNKGRYIRRSMSASQYESGENTKIYVHIVAS